MNIIHTYFSMWVDNMNQYLEIERRLKGYAKYKTHWNRERPYLCYIKDDEIYIYVKDENVPNNSPYDQDWLYTKLIKHYKTTKIFIGKDSGKCPSSDIGKNINFSIGNTILLKLEENKYIFIEGSIYEFTTSDEIITLFSLIGRNDVPYPVLLGSENVYFTLDHTYIARKYFPKNMLPHEYEDAYQLYYNYKDNKFGNIEETKKISKEAINFEFQNYEVVHVLHP